MLYTTERKEPTPFESHVTCQSQTRDCQPKAEAVQGIADWLQTSQDEASLGIQGCGFYDPTYVQPWLQAISVDHLYI